MNVAIYAGDIADAEAEAVATSTNPRLSLMMGTGASIRSRGGFAVLRECERILEAAGGSLPAGSVHVTTAGTLPHRVAIHCVASADDHRSSPEIVRRCTERTLAAAANLGLRSVALPVFGAGHARVPFAAAVSAIAGALREAPPAIASVVVAIPDRARADEARRIFEEQLGREVAVEFPQQEEDSGSFWSSLRD